MRHVTGATAPVHDWRGMAIRELTPPGIDAGEWYSYRNDDGPARLLSLNVPACDPAATQVMEPGSG